MPRKTPIKQMAKAMEYQKANVKQLKLDLNKVYDADIIEYLATLENRSGYLKQLIRDDMKTKIQ